MCLAKRKVRDSQTPAGLCITHNRPCPAQQGRPLPLGACSSTFFANPGGAQPSRPAGFCPLLLHTHPTPRPLSLLPSSSHRSDGQERSPALPCPQGTPWQAWHLPWAAWAEGASACQTPGRGRTGKQKPTSTLNPLPGTAAQARVGTPFSLPSPGMGASPVGLGTWRGGQGAAGRPPTALPPCARAPHQPGGRLHLPGRGFAPSPRWAPLVGWAAGAGRAGLSGGRAAAGAGGRGEGTLYEAAAGRKEALVSQAGRIPARGAHLSGQERGAAGPAPRKRLRLPRRRAQRTDGRQRGQGRSRPLSLRPALGAAPPHPSRLQTWLPGCPEPGMAS